MREPIEQRHRQLLIPEHARPLRELKVARHFIAFAISLVLGWIEEDGLNV